MRRLSIVPAVPSFGAVAVAVATALAAAAALAVTGCARSPEGEDAHAGHGHASAGTGHASAGTADAETAHAEAAKTAAASAAATPGTATKPAADPADWCAGHGVPESKCTVCNPALVASFKEAGDWCAAHGYPESVCPQCNPMTPPAGVPAPEGAPATGALATGAPAAGAAAAANGPPADGTRVVLDDDDIARRAAFTFATAALGGAQSGGIVAPVRVVYDGAHHASVTPRAPGIVREVAADVGTTVRAGRTLAVVESAEVGADRSRIAAARSRLAVADSEWKRLDDLHRQGIVATRDRQIAEQERDAAAAELRALEAAASIAGAAGEGGRYVIAAPISGTVVRRNVSLGAAVHTEDILFEIADTSVVWATIDVPERDAAALRTGQPVAIELDALPGRTFEGTLHWVGPEVDPKTRTIPARVRLDNRDGALRAGMYGRARLAAAGHGGAALVPRDAVQRVDGVPLVFVVRDARTFVVRRVTLGDLSGADIAVAAGLAPGERVVVDGAFLLRTETAKGSIGAGCCE